MRNALVEIRSEAVRNGLGKIGSRPWLFRGAPHRRVQPDPKTISYAPGVEGTKRPYLVFYVPGWSGLYNVFESTRSNPLYDAFFNADYDELIETSDF